MKRIREHNQDLKRLTKNERLAPNRGLLAVALSMYLDADEGPEKELFFNLLKNVWVDARRVRLWLDTEDVEMTPQVDRKQEKLAEIRAVFDASFARAWKIKFYLSLLKWRLNHKVCYT